MFRFLLCALLLTLISAVDVPWWSKKMVSMWYAPNNNWPQAVSLIKAHKGSVTSVMSYCGLDVRDNGTVITEFSSACASLFPALQSLGVQAEIVINAGNCSIDTYRLLWSDVTVSPRVLRDAVIAANASGLNVDFEPQADNCKGGPTGTAGDAASFAAWLQAVRAQLAPLGARLTVDVASWSPVLAQYAVLAQGVDRLLDMSTYNGDAAASWSTEFDSFVSKAPIDTVGVGLGGWSDGGNAWWETQAAANYKVGKSMAAKVPELAVFRIVPEESPSWPLDFWWTPLEHFLSGSKYTATRRL
jgi:hypothetical protein